MVPARTAPGLIAAQLTAAVANGGRLHLHCDFDGSLVPIAPHPELCRADPALRELLRRLNAHPAVEVAILSGRSLADLRRRIGLPGLSLAGNHGLEIATSRAVWRHPEAVALRPQLHRAARLARLRLEGLHGAFLEDKGLTLSLHSRQLPPASEPLLEQRLALLESDLAHCPGLRLQRGRRVVDIRPALDWNKAAAARLLCSRHGGAGLLFYAGDDSTDEDVFRAFPQAVTVQIASRARATAARHRVACPAELRGMLQQVLRQLPPRAEAP